MFISKLFQIFVISVWISRIGFELGNRVKCSTVLHNNCEASAINFIVPQKRLYWVVIGLSKFLQIGPKLRAFCDPPPRRKELKFIYFTADCSFFPDLHRLSFRLISSLPGEKGFFFFSIPLTPILLSQYSIMSLI